MGIMFLNNHTNYEIAMLSYDLMGKLGFGY